MEEQFCKDHKDVKTCLGNLKDERKFWHRLLGSKWSYIIIPALVMAILTWGGWVTKEIYAKEIIKERIATICQEVQDIKQDNKVRDEKREIEKKEEQLRREEDRKERDRRDRETMKILLDIQKQIKK